MSHPLAAVNRTVNWKQALWSYQNQYFLPQTLLPREGNGDGFGYPPFRTDNYIETSSDMTGRETAQFKAIHAHMRQRARAWTAVPPEYHWTTPPAQ